jgi:hypothetical protein
VEKLKELERYENRYQKHSPELREGKRARQTRLLMPHHIFVSFLRTRSLYEDITNRLPSDKCLPSPSSSSHTRLLRISPHLRIAARTSHCSPAYQSTLHYLSSPSAEHCCKICMPPRLSPHPSSPATLSPNQHTPFHHFEMATTPISFSNLRPPTKLLGTSL